MIKDKLRELRALDIELDEMRADKKSDIDNALTDEIRAILADIDEFYRNVFANFQADIDRITAEIKAEVLETKTSVRDDDYYAIYTKGRTTWDSKALSGYALAHPEINDLRKVGMPSVRIKK